VVRSRAGVGPARAARGATAVAADRRTRREGPSGVRPAHGRPRRRRSSRRGLGMRVVATAGHVDHGKSTLVQALTGTDPDRFPEEKRRGLTIDLGFAQPTLSSGYGGTLVD